MQFSITPSLTSTKLSDCSGTDLALISAGCFKAMKKVVISKASVKDGVMDVAVWARSQNCEKRLVYSSYLSVRPSVWNSPAPTGRLVMKFDVCVFFENLSRDRNFH